MRIHRKLIASSTLLALALAGVAVAQAPAPRAAYILSTQVAAREGAGVYREVCAACHMPDGKGAIGAGAYPALTNNEKLEVAGYPVALILNGQRAMPGFGRMLDDQQVAAVTSYIRTNFGNRFTGAVRADDVKTMR